MNSLIPEEINTLVEKAKKARENAFVPRSDHKIGSCVLTTNNEYYEGCNIETIISGLGICAERCAVDHAIIHGRCQFKAIATVDDQLTFPCGACLQYILQYYQINDENITIIVADLKGNVKTSSILELLPHGYLTQNSLSKIKAYSGK